MKRNHLIAGAVTVAALAGGTAGAVAATNDDKAAEQTVLSDAAKQLGVSADDLRAALSKAEDAQIDAEVKAGRLTQAQADEIKQHRQADGSVLGFGHGGPGERGGPGHGGPGGRFMFDDAAKAIGISEETLFGQLRDGKTLTAIAKAHGKTLADVKAAVKQAATARLDADLKAGRITQAQRDEEVGELDEELQHLGDPGGHRFHDGPRP
jgi:phage antirepressor YoqD-like protein